MKPELARKFAAVRRSFPHTKEVTYFNSASTGPIAVPVQKAIDAYLKRRVACKQDTSHDSFAWAEQLRAEYASFIGAKRGQVGLGMNTSFGLNVAAFGLPLKRGDEIIIAEAEFPAIVYTFRSAAESRGLKIKRIPPMNGGFDIEAFERAITKKTRMLAISWVQFHNGFKNDLARLGKICRAHNLYFVVDGIQGMGVEPINVRKLGIDIFTSGCQKWMLSPQGCGFFYVSERVNDSIVPPFMSWLGVDWKMQFSDLFHFDRPYFDDARRLDMGYFVDLNMAGMLAANNFFKELGIANIRQHNYELLDYLSAYLESNPAYTITSSRKRLHRSSIMTFTCEGYRELFTRLSARKIIQVPREGSIRVAIHLFNNKADVDRLIKELERFAGSSR